MLHRTKIFLGLAGVPPHDNPEAYQWENRLHWIMIGIAMLSLPAWYLEEIAGPHHLVQVGKIIDGVVLTAFVMELGWMLLLTRQKWLYLLRNWLDVLIILAAAVNLVGWGTEWAPLARLLRLAVVSLLLLRMMGSFRRLFTPHGIPYILGFGLFSLILSGAGFYLIEPTVHSFSEGIWLAFVSGATVGYGDIVPTTPLSRAFAVVVIVIGVSILSLVTASIAAFFVGQDEKRLRSDLHNDIKMLREEVRALREELRCNEAQRKAGAPSVGDADRSG